MKFARFPVEIFDQKDYQKYIFKYQKIYKNSTTKLNSVLEEEDTVRERVES